MEEVVMRGFKKRKQPSASSSSSSSPFSVASARSSSPVHVHRSYRPRPDSLKPPPALQAEKLFDSGGQMSRLSVKDLRARRVFSPSSPIVVSDDKCRDSECSDDVPPLKNAGMDQVSHANRFSETNPNAETPKQVESTESGELPNEARNAFMCGIEQFRVRDRDQCIQSTPLDDALGKLGPDCSWNQKSSAHVSKNLSNGRSNCVSVSDTKSVLNPCSRLKVFKVPNSLGYKRLLPYLMAVANERSCAQEIEKGSELDSTVESSSSQCEEIVGKKSEADGFPIVYQVNDSVSVEASASTPIKGSCHDNEPGLVSPKDIAGSQLSLDQKCASQVEQSKPVQEVDNMIPIPETNVSDILTSTLCHARTSLVQATCNMSSFHETDLHHDTSPVPVHCNMSPIHASSGSGEVPNGVRNADMCGIEQIRVREGDQCIKSTPLDDTLGKPEDGCSWNWKSTVHVSKNPSNGRSKVLNPCSRLKMFKVPNSLSYKRLLPYLMAVANERSCAQQIEKGSEIDPTVQSSGSQCEETLGKKFEVDRFPMVYQVNDFVSLETSVSAPKDGSCHDNEPGLVSPKDITGSQLSLDENCASRVEQSKPVQEVDNMIPIPETNVSDIPTSTLCHARTSLVQATCNMSSFRETDFHPKDGSCHDNEPGLVSPKDITGSQLSLDQNCASRVEQSKPAQEVDNMIRSPETNVSDIPTSTLCHARTSLVQATCNMSSFRETDFHPETSLVPAHGNMSPIHETHVHPVISPVQGLGNMSHIHETYFSTMTKSSPCQLGPSCRDDEVEVEERCLKSAKNEISTVVPCLGQDCLVAEKAVQLELPTARISKGVLKRNPRGCRGLCTCLSCASFRLHAERAFEFSKNQMQDAEEVALDLIKELSNLRKVLHKSVCSTNAILQVSEVKKACEKAFVAEELAKTRLGEMNDDLNHHCKITCLERPRVKFDDCIKERVIYNGTLDNPGDPEE